MHLKFYRRRAFGTLFGKRYPNPLTVSGTITSDNNDDSTGQEAGSGLTLTGPITITVTETFTSKSSEIPTSSTTESTTTSSSDNPSSVSASTASESPTTSATLSMTTVDQTSTSLTSFFTTSSSTTVLSTPSASVSVRPVASSRAETSKLPAGAIVGVVIACFLLLVASVIVIFRKRSVRNRIKLRGFWANRNTPLPTDKGISSEKYPFPAAFSPTVQPPANPISSWNSGGADNNILTNKAPITQPRVPVPRFIATPPPIMPAALEERSVSPGPKRGSKLNVVAASLPPLSPFGVTVKYTFYTSLLDELQITVGERVRILAEYDDGWGLCVNSRGEQGVIPLECIDRSDISVSPARLDSRLSVKAQARRKSSLPPTPRSPVVELNPRRF
ncbi:hypothetical protein BDQ17DRAFT_445541 [Cyathus striatus]|nr:hypothetical protein BDQ17DRAFT_445541 [Cyathus striatus]